MRELSCISNRMRVPRNLWALSVMFLTPIYSDTFIYFCQKKSQVLDAEHTGGFDWYNSPNIMSWLIGYWKKLYPALPWYRRAVPLLVAKKEPKYRRPPSLLGSWSKMRERTASSRGPILDVRPRKISWASEQARGGLNQLFLWILIRHSSANLWIIIEVIKRIGSSTLWTLNHNSYFSSSYHLLECARGKML